MLRTLGCFKKDTLEKNKNPTPVRYWGVPRKNISRRRGWSNKSRGSLKTLEVWQKFTRWRNRRCFWLWKVLLSSRCCLSEPILIWRCPSHPMCLSPWSKRKVSPGPLRSSGRKWWLLWKTFFSWKTGRGALEWCWSHPVVCSAANSPLQREENDAETQKHFWWKLIGSQAPTTILHHWGEGGS